MQRLTIKRAGQSLEWKDGHYEKREPQRGRSLPTSYGGCILFHFLTDSVRQSAKWSESIGRRGAIPARVVNYLRPG